MWIFLFHTNIVFSSVLFCFLFFSANFQSNCFFSFSVASHFVIKRFSHCGGFFAGHQHFGHKKCQRVPWPFVMNTFNCLKWRKFFTPFDFVHPICGYVNCQIVTSYSMTQPKKSAADRFVTNVINFDMVHFLEPFFPLERIFQRNNRWSRTQFNEKW